MKLLPTHATFSLDRAIGLPGRSRRLVPSSENVCPVTHPAFGDTFAGSNRRSRSAETVDRDVVS